MEEGVLPLSTILGTSSDTFMDLDYMDELLMEGCWLEANGSEFSQFDSSATPISPFEPAFAWPVLEANNGGESGGSPSKDGRDERQRSSFPENLSISQSEGPQHYRKPLPHVENICNAFGSSAQSENYLLEVSELTKRWWIGPRASTPVMDRLIQALGYIKDRSRDKDVLIQVWVPVIRGGKRVLTTSNQPFSLEVNCPRLAHYREISVNYQFPAEEDSKEVVGLPGRVFRSKVPEWTPDVRFFTRDEYPRVGHAQQYDVRGTLAVPVLEQGSHSCLGVIEVVLTTQKIQYRPELESVCKALEAVDLRSAEVSSAQNIKTSDLSYQAALPEILEVLRSACGAHGLPLAQTWIQCTLQGKGGCRHSEENLRNCVSPVDSACYIGDSRIQGFHDACSEYHLLKGQGIVGRAFRTNQPCFSPDVTAYSQTEYPLSHHARMFGLNAAVAIRLRSICTGSADFVLEFFLPMNCKDPEEQKKLLTSLSTIIQNVCRTLRVVSDKELLEESVLADEEANYPVMSISKEVQRVDHAPFLQPYSGQVNHQESGSAVSPFQNGKSGETLAESSEVRLAQPDSNPREGVTFDTNTSTSGDGSSLYTNKTGEKRRIKAEKTITLQVLRQHFAGSLKDAARNLGVCPTTLKRICRQHGIQRWPSRKIKKVGHSLQKIQRVIDSVQGASGVLQIESFYSNFPELASPNASRTTPFSHSKSADNLKPLEGQPESSVLRPPAAASVSPSSSCSQSSSSSQCCSSGAQPNSYSTGVAGLEDPVVKEEPDNSMLKRTRSDANLHFSSDGPKLLPRSQSHVSFCWPDKPGNAPLAAEGAGQKPQEGDPPRIKVTYGEDTIRFRMQSNWKYKDLLQEISRRFGVDNASGFHLKYLDDDAEWVLLTCDADLEECIEVCRSSRNQTIKLVFLRGSQTQFGRSSGIRFPLSL
ncbi:protein NLP4 [Sesamum alatum]|uniref:Protein NLP4 n=1 Tax=Sesamum alatum TaxID=300844 RepID=A0AAE2CTN3_9LAMI|nr:protein NLP4 [Sesamum alatum]